MSHPYNGDCRCDSCRAYERGFGVFLTNHPETEPHETQSNEGE